MSTLETSGAFQEIQTQIQILSAEESIRQALLERLAQLDLAGITKAHSFITATLAEKVALNVAMVARFMDVDLSELTETA